MITKESRDKRYSLQEKEKDDVDGYRPYYTTGRHNQSSSVKSNRPVRAESVGIMETANDYGYSVQDRISADQKNAKERDMILQEKLRRRDQKQRSRSDAPSDSGMSETSYSRRSKKSDQRRSKNMDANSDAESLPSPSRPSSQYSAKKPYYYLDDDQSTVNTEDYSSSDIAITSNKRHDERLSRPKSRAPYVEGDNQPYDLGKRLARSREMLSTSQGGDSNAYGQPSPYNRSASNPRLAQRQDIHSSSENLSRSKRSQSRENMLHSTGSRGNLTKSPLEDDDDFDYPPPPPKDVSYHRSSENVANRYASNESLGSSHKRSVPNYSFARSTENLSRSRESLSSRNAGSRTPKNTRQSPMIAPIARDI